MTAHQHIRRAYGVDLLLSQHPAIQKLKRSGAAPSIHGNKFWGSSYLLMDYLQKNPITKGSRVLELGCGWGLASIYCAKTFGADVTAIDADDAVFPYLKLHAEVNGTTIKTRRQRFEKISKLQLSAYDLVIGADICFWDELSDVLYHLVNRAVNAGVKKIVLTDPERSPFFDLANRCIDRHCAELDDWSVSQPRRATGCVLSIENQ